MKKYLIFLFLCTMALMSSCGLYTRYADQPLGYDAGQIVGQDSLSAPLATMSWRKLFADSLLVNWIDSGLKTNTDLRIAQLRVEEAEATLTASRLAFLPAANLFGEGSLSNKSGNSFEIGASASWELDVFGKQRNLHLSSQAAYYASQSYCQAVRTSLIATIAESYYTLLMLDEQLEISERTIKNWNENIRVLQALKRAGRANEAAILQAKANKMKVENSAITLKEQIDAQENAVRSLLLNPMADLSRGKLLHQTFPDTLSLGIALDYISNRPDVREAEYLLQSSFYDMNVARSAFYPSITLSGSVGWVTSTGGGIGNPATWLSNALGGVVAPLFNRGTNMKNLKIAESEYEIRFQNYQQRLLDAGMEVNNALSEWQSAKQRLTLDKKQIVALKGAVHNTRLLMRNSSTNYLEVLTAQQRLLESELAEVADRYAEIRSVIRLFHALGGDYE